MRSSEGLKVVNLLISYGKFYAVFESSMPEMPKIKGFFMARSLPGADACADWSSVASLPPVF